MSRMVFKRNWERFAQHWSPQPCRWGTELHYFLGDHGLFEVHTGNSSCRDCRANLSMSSQQMLHRGLAGAAGSGAADCPFHAAHMRAVQPSSLCWLMSAPCSRIWDKRARFPLFAASMNDWLVDDMAEIFSFAMLFQRQRTLWFNGETFKCLLFRYIPSTVNNSDKKSRIQTYAHVL